MQSPTCVQMRTLSGRLLCYFEGEDCNVELGTCIYKHTYILQSSTRVQITDFVRAFINTYV